MSTFHRCHIAQGQDTYQTLLPIQHRKPSHLDLDHVARNLVRIFVLETILHFTAHDVADRRLGSLALRNRTHREIPVRDHPDEPVIVADGQDTGIGCRTSFWQRPESSVRAI
jgi:hypothetical protein